MSMPSIEDTRGGVLLRVRVQPKASRNELLVEADGRLRAALTAPPVEGAANRALIALLARQFKLPKSSITLFRGERSRDKTVRLQGRTAREVEELIRA
jgi:uncharacterized protein